MECTSHIDKLNSAIDYAKSLSLKERTVSQEAFVNSFLDKVLEVQKTLDSRTEQVYNIISMLEALTWTDFEITDSVLMSLNDLLAIVNDWRCSLEKNYIDNSVDVIRKVASSNLHRLQGALDDLSEICQDFESIYFDKNHFDELKAISNSISEL